MRNQDPRGRRGQPLQDREPLPGAKDEESRRRPAGATSTRLRATARGRRGRIKTKAGGGNLPQDRRATAWAEEEESRPKRPAGATSTRSRATARGRR